MCVSILEFLTCSLARSADEPKLPNNFEELTWAKIREAFVGTFPDDTHVWAGHSSSIDCESAELQNSMIVMKGLPNIILHVIEGERLLAITNKLEEFDVNGKINHEFCCYFGVSRISIITCVWETSKIAYMLACTEINSMTVLLSFFIVFMVKEQSHPTGPINRLEIHNPKNGNLIFMVRMQPSIVDLRILALSGNLVVSTPSSVSRYTICTCDGVELCSDTT